MGSERDVASIFYPFHSAKKQHIERLVFSGGGAKGAVYPGSYKAVEEAGLMKEIKEIAGASAGSIVAAFIAVGMTSASSRGVLLTTSLEKLMGNTIGSIFGNSSAGVCFITKDGNPLERFIRDHIVAAVRTTMGTLDQRWLIASECPEIDDVLSKIESEHPRLTFGDLAILNRFFPNKFKKLVVSAIKFPDGELQIFNAELTPNVEIALACRASASLPVILEPVEIEINGKKQKFVDGGYFDNLPTDYFDIDESGVFVKNKKPEQTLVFAFGEGLDNKKNEVFQALYGGRWDEIISHELLMEIIGSAIKLSLKLDELDARLVTPEEEARLLLQAVKFFLEQQVKAGKISVEVSLVILNAMEKTAESILLTPHEHPEFWTTYHHDKDEATLMQLFCSAIMHNMKPVLSDASMHKKLVCDVLVGVLGGLTTPYKNTIRDEAGYHKLRDHYPLRTVELRVGTLTTIDFSKATKLARIMDAFGYLDTINHISNHELHDPGQFNPQKFYVDIVNYFEHIYLAVLHGCGRDPKEDALVQEIAALRKQLATLAKSEAVISRQIYQLIKEKAEGGVDSVEAFALSRAVEFRNEAINADDLFKETYMEGFKRSSIFSVSDITGERFFKVNTLHESLKSRSMFDLYRHKSGYAEKSRTDKVFESLQKMELFSEAYHRYSPEKDKSMLAAG